MKKQELKKQDIVMGNVKKILKEMHASAIYSQTKDGYGAMCVSIGTIERILRANMEGAKIMGEIKNNEAINELLFLKEKLYNGIFEDRLGCIDYAISMIKEAERYREIGTLDEIREAKEKRTPMQPDVEGDGEADGFPVYDTWICPSCGEAYEIGYDDHDFCPKCGQKINRDILINMES